MRIVLMPMAGLGIRFSAIHEDKKLAPVPPDGEPMFIHAIQHLGFSFDFVVLLPQKKESVESILIEYPKIHKKVKIIETKTLTQGPLDTIMYARPILLEYSNAEIVICNCDQVLVWPGNWALEWFKKRGAVGGIPTIERKSDRHSYVKLDDNYACRVIRVREKEKISNRATIGVYWFNNAAKFLHAAECVFEQKDTAPNGEYYVSHVYNYLNDLILEYPLCEFWSLGEPENYSNYITRNYALEANG